MSHYIDAVNLLNLRNTQETLYKVDKTATQIIVLRLDNNNNYKHTLTKHGDTVSFKGAIVNSKDILSLRNKLFTIEIGGAAYDIPFDFVLTNKIEIDTDTFFIPFNQKYLLNHNILMVALAFHEVVLLIHNIDRHSLLSMDTNLKIDIICEYTYLENHIRKDMVCPEVTHTFNIRQIVQYVVPNTRSNPNPNLNCICYKSCVQHNQRLLSDGLFIEHKLKNIKYVNVNVNKSSSQKINVFNYNTGFTQLYGQSINDNLSYFGFNLNDKFDNTDYSKCINMAMVDSIDIEFWVSGDGDGDSDTECKDQLNCYLSYWSTVNYRAGMLGFLHDC